MTRRGMQILVTALALATASLSAQERSVVQSVHNLSSTGTVSTIKSTTESGVCIFCHSPHNTQGMKPLWNRQMPTDPYANRYTSTTFNQTNQPVTDRAKLCLSCHDGTIALGQTIANGNLGITTAMPTSSSAFLGTDLRRDHPFGFTLPAQDDGEIAQWLRTSPVQSPDPTVQVFDSKIECVTCHDPHVPNKDNVVQKFLVRNNASGALCLTCHDSSRGNMSGWLTSQHATATNYTINASSGLPYDSVATTACNACHRSHNSAGTGPRLLRTSEEADCSNCHGPTPVVTPAPRDIMTVLSSNQYKHPVTTVADAHDAGETVPVNTTRHSECADCHNPHTAQASGTTPQTAPAVENPNLGVNGITVANAALMPAQYEYQICLKCHGGSTNKPQKAGFDTTFGRTPIRQSFSGVTDPENAALEFQSVLPRHNVTKPLSGTVVNSLRAKMLDLSGYETGPSLSSNQYIYCADCHNSDQNRRIGGSGPNGPHASRYRHLLERNYQMEAQDGTFSYLPGRSGQSGQTNEVTPYVAGVTYAMCDKCHDVQGKLVTGGSPVQLLHNRHVVQDQLTCSACHSSHGVQSSDSTQHGWLVDLDTQIATQNAGPATQMVNLTPGAQSCSLTCHGWKHKNSVYR